jgi:hypothetical protein
VLAALAAAATAVFGGSAASATRHHAAVDTSGSGKAVSDPTHDNGSYDSYAQGGVQLTPRGRLPDNPGAGRDLRRLLSVPLRFRDDSELARLNRSGGRPFASGPLLLEALDVALGAASGRPEEELCTAC